MCSSASLVLSGVHCLLLLQAADEVSKLGSAFRIPQRDFFKALVRAEAAHALSCWRVSLHTDHTACACSASCPLACCLLCML